MSIKKVNVTPIAAAIFCKVSNLALPAFLSICPYADGVMTHLSATSACFNP